MNKQAYKQRLEALLLDLYRKKAEQKATTERFQIEGFMEAGLLSEVVSNADLQELIDNTHFKVFGISYNARNLSDREWIDIPAYIREKVIKPI
ncbi:hypothetical protein THMIRHAS_24240 [Thiosulfatimonas sediminis]|uniref:Uncharacterized protein n=1 Tax=Thiosulfatimonas sediminis TaxID=2675054 RepID=A0A6F8PY51_9GAMM|nr:hypothetical protein [Thiosulfatimonas sediminis]BBP47051.1 hypothetical protein THMIRHAS_24240 [Thiosulfatimonas sediminis]